MFIAERCKWFAEIGIRYHAGQCRQSWVIELMQFNLRVGIEDMYDNNFRIWISTNSHLTNLMWRNVAQQALFHGWLTTCLPHFAEPIRQPHLPATRNYVVPDPARFLFRWENIFARIRRIEVRWRRYEAPGLHPATDLNNRRMGQCYWCSANMTNNHGY